MHYFLFSPRMCEIFYWNGLQVTIIWFREIQRKGCTILLIQQRKWDIFQVLSSNIFLIFQREPKIFLRNKTVYGVQRGCRKLVLLHPKIYNYWKLLICLKAVLSCLTPGLSDGLTGACTTSTLSFIVGIGGTFFPNMRNTAWWSPILMRELPKQKPHSMNHDWTADARAKR